MDGGKIVSVVNARKESIQAAPFRDQALPRPGPQGRPGPRPPVWRCGSKMGIDATRRLPEEGHPRPWPDEIEMSPEVKELVSRRWKEYGF